MAYSRSRERKIQDEHVGVSSSGAHPGALEDGRDAAARASSRAAPLGSKARPAPPPLGPRALHARPPAAPERAAPAARGGAPSRRRWPRPPVRAARAAPKHGRPSRRPRRRQPPPPQVAAPAAGSRPRPSARPAPQTPTHPLKTTQELGLCLGTREWAAARLACRHWRRHVTAGVQLLELDLERSPHRWAMVTASVRRLFPRLRSVTLLVGTRVTPSDFSDRMAELALTIDLSELELRYVPLAAPRLGSALGDVRGVAELLGLKVLKLSGGPTPTPECIEVGWRERASLGRGVKSVCCCCWGAAWRSFCHSKCSSRPAARRPRKSASRWVGGMGRAWGRGARGKPSRQGRAGGRGRPPAAAAEGRAARGAPRGRRRNRLRKPEYAQALAGLRRLAELEVLPGDYGALHSDDVPPEGAGEHAAGCTCL